MRKYKNRKSLLLGTAFLICAFAMPVYAAQSSTVSVVSDAGDSSGETEKQKPFYMRIDPIDEEYRIEVRDYKSTPERLANGAKSMKYDRHVQLVSDAEQKVMIEWLFRAVFVYNGKSCRCTDTDVIVKNFALRDFLVTEHDLEAAGNSAVGSCGAVLKKKGVKYGEKIQIDVNLLGEVDLQ